MVELCENTTGFEIDEEEAIRLMDEMPKPNEKSKESHAV